MKVETCMARVPECGPQGQAFRAQPMGLCLQGSPSQPQTCSFQQSRPGSTSTALRLRPPDLPLQSEFLSLSEYFPESAAQRQSFRLRER